MYLQHCWLLWKPCWLPACEPLSGWSFQGAVRSQGFPGLSCGDRHGIMQRPQPSVLTNGHRGLLDLGHLGNWAVLDPCDFTPFWWEYFKFDLPSLVRRKHVPAPKMHCLFLDVTIEDIERSAGKQHIVVPLAAREERVPHHFRWFENPRQLGNQATLSCHQTFQQRLDVSHV